MIEQARVWCENYISKDIVAKQRIYFVPKTNGQFDLPFAPVNSIDEVKINDVVTTDYEMVGLNNETIEFNSGEATKVSVKYTTLGLSDNLLKQAMLQLISTYYENREDFVVGSAVNEVPTNVKSILASFKTMYV
jgi:ethanolamine utilization protein EutA (predicted chaperonin)